MADPRITQHPVEIVKQDDGGAVVSQAPVEIVKTDDGDAVVSQAPVELVVHVAVPQVNMSQMVVEIVGKGLFDEDHINVFVAM